MTLLAHTDPLVKHLCELLGLPKYVQSFEIRVALDELVTVKCTYFPEVDATKGIPPITGRFNLVRIEAPPTLTDEVDVTDLTQDSREFRKRA